ncbi:MAG: prefoldin subunit beta [Candidatus Nanoarchaeia archaeon]
MNIDSETQEKIKELQFYEQNLQNILMQKQAFQFELTETENALNEVSSSKDDIFKIVGSIMIKAEKSSVEKELKEKKELLALRMKSIEKQEKSLSENAEKLKQEVMKKLK